MILPCAPYSFGFWGKGDYKYIIGKYDNGVNKQFCLFGVLCSTQTGADLALVPVAGLGFANIPGGVFVKIPFAAG
jgi:hypothetical protein